MSEVTASAPTVIRRMVRSTILAVALIAAIAVALALIAVWGGDDTDPTPLVLGVTQGPFSASLILAHDKGYFADENLAVTMEAHASGRQALASLHGPGLRLATAADTGAGSAIVGGEPITVFGVIASIIDLVVVAYRVDHGISKPQDLVGRRIGLMPGSTSEYFLEVMLDLHGIDIETMTLIHKPIEDLSAALLAGEIDAAVLWSPHYDQVREQGPGTIGIFGNEGLYHWSFFLAGKQGDEEASDVADRVMRALIRAGGDIAREPEANAERVAAWLNVSPQRILGLWSWCSFDVQLGRSALLQLENAVSWAQDKHTGGSLPNNRIDVLDHIDPIPLHRVDPIRVRLIHPRLP